MIKNLVFDLGKVLIEWNPDKILNYFTESKDSRREVREAVFDSGIWSRADQGELSLQEAYELAAAQLSPQGAAAAKNIFYHWYEVVEVYHALQEQILGWARQGYRIYILSTTCEIFYHIDRAGLLPVTAVLSGKVLSAEVGAVKPQREIYLKLLEEYSLAAAESVFIDDIQANLDAAAELGFQTILAQGESENIAALSTLLSRSGCYGSGEPRIKP